MVTSVKTQQILAIEKEKKNMKESQLYFKHYLYLNLIYIGKVSNFVITD